MGNTRAISIACAAAFAAARCAAAGGAPWSAGFDAGANLRIRQEIMDNTPGLPGGGVAMPRAAGPYRNHMRFRPRFWAQAGDGETWRVYSRFTDEFRWNVRPRNHSNTFPDEMIIDNLYVEAKDLFDGVLDFRAGRQDMYNLYGLDNLFVDGTPGDGSRTVYTDMARIGLDFREAGRFDVFALYNKDDNQLRWGTERGRHKSLTGFGGGAEPEMDDWGWGGIYSNKAGEALPYKIFAMQKRVLSYRRGGVKHSAKRRDLAGFRVEPRLTDETTALLEAMGQTGRDGEGGWFGAWSACAGLSWKDSKASSARPFAGARIHFMSGDKDAAKEDGGRHAWDPMWSRGVNYSELFLYGTHYGAAWWSNMAYAKTEGGFEFGPHHRVCASTGAMFAQTDDGLGGGDGSFKGVLSLVRYDFPILTADRGKGERFEIFGHIYAELFNPGDYFETDKPAWFVRWQVEFAF
ncbi:MAG: hypothetical protein IIT98_02205 [Kiritimatiellae bacterium]|nr:hypothetical protein [Kiritimatiellia bacterium]